MSKGRSMINKDISNIKLIIASREKQGYDSADLRTRIKSLEEIRDNLDRKYHHEASGAFAAIQIYRYVRTILGLSLLIYGYVFGIRALTKFNQRHGAEFKSAKERLDDMVSKKGLPRRMPTDLELKNFNDPNLTAQAKKVKSLSIEKKQHNAAMFKKFAILIAVAVIIVTVNTLLTRLAISYYAGKLDRRSGKHENMAIKLITGALRRIHRAVQY